MRRPEKRKTGAGATMALVAFLGALMCIAFFSVKVLLFVIATLLIVLGLFLIRL